MRRLSLILALALLAGCGRGSGGEGMIGFQASGTGYTCRPASLSISSGASGSLVTLTGGSAPGPALALTVAASQVGAAELAGATLDIRGSSGRIDLGEAGRHEISAGTLTLQTFQEGLARGNFELKTRGDLEIRGSFDAVFLGE